MAAKRPKKEPTNAKRVNTKAYIAGAGSILRQPIDDTLEQNYMPYAMSVILSRAIPEIDGFKPSHRKLLYTMYKMGLLGSTRTKSANIVGQTMRLNPHGDQTIYETMVRLSRGYEALLHPYVDSKGNFGKAYSRDMVYAASRYTEAKLEAISAELFKDIDKDTVDFIDNYDNTMKEPALLPATFPSILVNSNVGIAVGMASSICPFNLSEVCETTIALLKNPEHVIADTLKAPDFPGGGTILYDPKELDKIYETGRGGIKVRCRYNYDKSQNCIEITEIPPTTTVEAIMDKVLDLMKAGKIREISDMRDETDLAGLKVTIDLKRGIDPEKLMQKLYRLTPLEDTFSCNFNVLIDGYPMVLGIRKLLGHWIRFRKECVVRRTCFDLKKKREKLHLLKGLAKILLDIDKAIAIIRQTEEETEVVSNLMIGFGIDATQAEYVAEIKLRHLNREYILKRTQETESLEKEIVQMEEILGSDKKISAIMISELKEVGKKYGQPRKSLIADVSAEEIFEEEEEIPDYPVHVFLTKEGYFKKITPQSLRMSSEHKLKQGDERFLSLESTNNTELLVFTNLHQVYKARLSDFEDSKASVLGDYLPAKLSMEEGETVVSIALTKDYSGYMLFVFRGGRVAKVPLASYQTKTRRKKLMNAYCSKLELCQILALAEDTEIMLTLSNGRVLAFSTAQLAPKQAKDTQGVIVASLKGKVTVAGAEPFDETRYQNADRIRVKSLPSTGVTPKDAQEMQLKLGE